MLRLIVNADDLGLTNGVNRGIFQGHSEGIVTSATLMANSTAFDEAVAALKSNPELRNLSVGCHVVLIDGAPLSPPEQVRSLLDPASSSPAFERKLWKFALRAIRGKISTDEVECETAAQIRKVQSAGIEVSHVDTHKHSHMFPSVLEGVLKAAKATGVRAIRNVFEPPFARPASIKFSRSAIRSVETNLLRRKYERPFREKVKRYGLTTTDGTIGVAVTGALDEKLFANTIRNLPKDGTFEFVSHPGFNDAELASAGTRLLQSREIEMSLFCARETRELLDALGIELTNYRKLTTQSESNSGVAHPMP